MYKAWPPQPLAFPKGFPGLPSTSRPAAGDFSKKARELKASLRPPGDQQ
jgi:hypothetical protein